MVFDHGHDFFQIFRATDLFFYIAEGEKFITHQFAQFFRKLLLSFRENALEGNTQESLGFSWVKKHFDGDPVGHPANKGRNQWYQDQPVVHKMV